MGPRIKPTKEKNMNPPIVYSEDSFKKAFERIFQKRIKPKTRRQRLKRQRRLKRKRIKESEFD